MSDFVNESNWQAQRLQTRDVSQQMVREMIDEASEQSEKTVMSGSEQPQPQLHDAIISDEAWHVKRIAGKNERVAELQRYVMRVVQYVAYGICGRHADQLLARIKGRPFSELLRQYNECLRIAQWDEHNPFLERSLIEALMYVFEHADGDPIRRLAEDVHEKLRTLLQLQTGVRDARIRYPQLRTSRTIILSDVNAGFETTEYDWCGMADFLKFYAQYENVQELNTERCLKVVTARSRLENILPQPPRGTTFHIFWSPRDFGGGLRSDVAERITDLRTVVRSLTQQGQTPYICLDITSLDEWDRKNSSAECAALVTSLQACGGIVERSDTFWAERIQYSVRWDPLQGAVIDCSKAFASKDLQSSLDASDPLDEKIRTHFDPRKTLLPSELIPLCNLYDRHILRQKVIIELSLPLKERTELRSSGGDVATKDVDHIYLWHLVRGREVDEESRRQPDFEMAVEMEEDDVILVSEDADADGVSRTDEGEDLTPPMDLNLGMPDYQPTWIAGAEVKQRGPMPCSLTQPCDLQHLCLRCRARHTRSKYDQWDLTVEWLRMFSFTQSKRDGRSSIQTAFASTSWTWITI